MGMFSGLGSLAGGVLGGFFGGPSGAAIGSGLGSMFGGQADNRQAWSYSKKAADYQNGQQLQFWALNNAYNSPKSVMARLEEAGLNPNLVYQNGGAAYQATMPTAAKAGFQYIHDQNPLMFQQLENMESQNDLLRQQKLTSAAQNRIYKANARIAEKDAQIYEDTGVRPGDSPTKSIWRAIADWFSFDGDSRVGRAWKDTKEKFYEANADKFGHSQNNSANVRFRD